MFAAAAPWVVVVALVAAIAVVAVVARSTWQAWRSLQRTTDAASALMDVHQARLDASVAAAGSRAGELAREGEELAEVIADFRSNVTHLRWLIDRIPTERERLRRSLLDLLLPTERTHA